MQKKAVFIKKVVAKLTGPELSKKDTFEILSGYIDLNRIIENEYHKKMNISEEQMTELREVYLKSAVNQLYTYGEKKFGFILGKLRFDIDHSSLEIKKIV